MIHPLFKLMAAHPTVLTDHVEAYASLAVQELGTAATQWRSRALKTGIAMLCAASAAVLAGVSLMLSAQKKPAEGPFAILRGQFAEDMALLREVNA